MTHTLLARAWETLLVMMVGGGGIKDDHKCVSTHTYKRTHRSHTQPTNTGLKKYRALTVG